MNSLNYGNFTKLERRKPAKFSKRAGSQIFKSSTRDELKLMKITKDELDIDNFGRYNNNYRNQHSAIRKKLVADVPFER